MLRSEDVERAMCQAQIRLDLHLVRCEVCSDIGLCSGAIRLRRVVDQAKRLLDRRKAVA